MAAVWLTMTVAAAIVAVRLLSRAHEQQVFDPADVRLAWRAHMRDGGHVVSPSFGCAEDAVDWRVRKLSAGEGEHLTLVVVAGGRIVGYPANSDVAIAASRLAAYFGPDG